MKSYGPTIEQLDVSSYTIPTDAPESDGTLAWDRTTLVLVQLHAAGHTGTGYTYADKATARLVHDKLRDIVVGRAALDTNAIVIDLYRAIRNLGRPGIASMAISAVDTALWDLKAHILDVPLVALLGAARPSIPAYGSGGFTSYSDAQLTAQFRGWVEQGITVVKMKVGRDPARDPHRVKVAREAIGANTALFIDANGAFSPRDALAFAQRLAPYDVTWFEEPVSSDDLAGLRAVRARAPDGMAIAAGEYGYDAFYFRRMLDAEAVDVLQADGTRCGGVTGFLRAAALCEAYAMPLSAHTSPSLHAHLCCAVGPARHVEYFHDHVRIEQMLFDGAIRATRGVLEPDRSRAGLGLEFKRSDAARFAA